MRPPPSPGFESLAGSLLLAHPILRDVHFRRSVVLMSSHDEAGAVGLVLNRPVGKSLNQLMSDFILSPLAEVPVYYGGPVEPDRLLLCAWRIDAIEAGFRLYFGLEPESAAELATSEGIHLRAFMGYSGWERGQLEAELERDSWAVTSIPGTLMDLPQDERLWRGILAELGHEWTVLADEPDTPGAN